MKAGSPAYVYTAASSLWAPEEPASGIPGTDPWVLGFISVLSPSSHCPAWLPTAPGQGPSFVGKWQSGLDCPRGASTAEGSVIPVLGKHSLQIFLRYPPPHSLVSLETEGQRPPEGASRLAKVGGVEEATNYHTKSVARTYLRTRNRDS